MDGRDRPGETSDSHRSDGLDSTVELVRRAKQGDRDALDRLLARYMQPLRRWASGRLPAWARELLDTDDLVQDTLLKTVRNVGGFEPRQSGSFHAYLRTGLKNRIQAPWSAPPAIPPPHRWSRRSASARWSATSTRWNGCRRTSARRSWRESSWA
jgi:hypothetical protein